ncbi:hypothetical protein RAS2_26220 [Phycisphaerae bacterium RAS2]|nr:hypothetical protein RAS2_26220 [Phycisphaerae bacterium RAS2]
MPRSNTRFSQAQCDVSQPELSPAERLRAVASILARGVARWRQHVRAGRSMHVSSDEDSPGIGLEVPGETRPSVSHDTHGLRLRADGDEP